MPISSDLPISIPSEDRYELDPFAKTLALSIEAMPAATGVVLAVNGPWGSGKSSAIKLVKHHLAEAVQRGDLAIVSFNPWWFPGSDALILAFFRELNAAIGPSLPQKLQKSISRLGQGVSSIGGIIGAAADLKAPGLGSLITGAASRIGDWTKFDKTVEDEHSSVAAALSGQKKRFLVVIDDIDRLNPDDAMTVFRLIKSIGRLPNVIYLLAFDRQIAERIVSERFPAEGVSYLEKIIQGAFELPPPLLDHLRWNCIEAALQIMGEPTDEQRTRFGNVFYDLVAPTIRTPRDIMRITNQLSATYPAVKDNVDRADFLAITALQLAEPDVYAAIRHHPDRLCGVEQMGMGRSHEGLGKEYDELFALCERPERERQKLRIALRRLFPRLDAIWGNTYHQGDDYRRDRRIASEHHFRNYFAFALSDDNLSAEWLDRFIANSDDTEFVTAALREALTTQRRTGETRASLVLDELNVHVQALPPAKVPALVKTLFAMGDEIDVKADARRGFNGTGDNRLRLHWLLNRLNELLSPAQRDQVYQNAMEGAALSWLVDFAQRCAGYYEPSDKSRGEAIVSENVAKAFLELALKRTRQAAADGTLVASQHLTVLLFRWANLVGDNEKDEVRAWSTERLADPAFIVALAAQMPSSSWSYGMGMDEMGDRIQRENVNVNVGVYSELIDVELFEKRVAEELSAGRLAPADLDILKRFVQIPRGGHG